MRFILILTLAVFIFTGCADSLDFTITSEYETVGFWYGLWHGVIIVVSFVVSLFDDTVSIYAIYNSGGWYDFGYVLGVMIVLGSSNQTYCSKKRVKCSEDGKHTKITIDVESLDKES